MSAGMSLNFTSIFFWWTLFRLTGQFTPVLALYDPFGVDVPLNFDITHSLTELYHGVNNQIRTICLGNLAFEPPVQLKVYLIVLLFPPSKNFC